jgi:hypothetical protein
VSLEKLLLPSDSDDSDSDSDCNSDNEEATPAVSGNDNSSGRKKNKRNRKAPSTIFKSQSESIHHIDYVNDITGNNITGIISESERDLMKLFSDLKNENLVVAKVKLYF